MLALLLAAAASAQLAAASGGWSASPVVRLEPPRFSVSGATPGCQEELVMEGWLRWLSATVAAAGGLQHGGEGPAAVAERVALAVGDLTYRLGSPMVLQRHAVCSSLCTPIPLDASSVSVVRTFYANRPGEPFSEVPIGTWGAFIRWDDAIDTTLVNGEARWVCLQVRNWVDYPREVFFLVRYER